jgi:5'-methylthioadenosine phosphorylase
MIVANLVANAQTAQQVIAQAVDRLPYERTCPCATAIANSILTSRDAIPENLKRYLAPIVSKYL